MGLGYSLFENDVQNERSSLQRVYGWKKDEEDHRDLVHDFTISPFQSKVEVVDWRSHCPPVYNQLSLGSCTANAIAAAYEFDQIHQGESKDDIFTPSRLFVYYNEREIEGTVDEDSGASLRDGIKTVAKIGVCPESEWEYDISKFTVKPDEKCYTDALHHVAIEYKRVLQTIHQLKQGLMEGYPIVFGFTVYESFEGDEIAKTGMMKMPKKDEKVLGGHAVMAVGYDDFKKAFIVRNSWGEEWGIDGYFYMPYEFIKNPDYASDFWTIRKVRDNSKVDVKNLAKSQELRKLQRFDNQDLHKFEMARRNTIC